MLLGLATAALVLGALVWELSRPRLTAGVTRGADTRARAPCFARSWLQSGARRDT